MLRVSRVESSDMRENEEHLLCAVMKAETVLTAQEEKRVMAVKFSYLL